MEATAQQASGGGSLYSFKTRLGNWQEEIAIGEAKLNNFRHRSETGNLSLRKQEIKLERCNEIVPLSYCADNILRWGDSVIIRHDSSGALLACDPFEKVIQNSEQYLVTGSIQPVTAKARQVFKLLKPPANLQDQAHDYSDSILKFGQSFCLGCTESMMINPGMEILNAQLYLCSSKKTERMCTKTTNRQLVYLSTAMDGNAIWQFLIPSKGRINGSERFLAMGQPIYTDLSIQIQHRQTCMYLLCDPKMKMNSEFGTELECYADRTALHGKLSLMASEMAGSSTPLTLQKPDDPSYIWKVITAVNEDESIDNRDLPPTATLERILVLLKSSIKARGFDGCWSLRSYLNSLTSSFGITMIDHEDLKDAILKWGIPMDVKYLEIVLAAVDKSKKGVMNWKDFLNIVRGEVSSSRIDAILQAYNQIDQSTSGMITYDECVDHINTSHPLCVQNGLTTIAAVDHMFTGMGVGGQSISKKATLLKNDFIEYHLDMSACIDDDELFVSLMKECWI
jgi:Ca2+-binding EF-hand superfamily protein